MAPLLVEIEDGIATVMLNRPEALNALSLGLRRELVETLRDLDARPDVRAILLTGSGRAFSAGLDVKELSATGEDVSSAVETQDLGAVIAGLKTPIIAAVNGLAVTGGFEITLACDIALAAQSAWFADTHVQIGLLPGWGLSQRLARIVGPARAKGISLTARRVPAAEAAALGIVAEAVPDDELMIRARGLAVAIAQWPSENVTRLKALIDRGYDLPFAEALRYERAVAHAANAERVLDAGDRPV